VCRGRKKTASTSTREAELDLIDQRLKRAKEDLQAMVNKQEADIPVTASSGNVFADMGLPEAGEELTKALLESRIRQS